MIHFLQIDASTGIVSPKILATDFEAFQKLTFIVVGTDGGTPALSATATVTVVFTDVNDNDPVFR